MAIEPLQFPPLILSLEDTVDWPLPPSAWRQAAPLKDPVHPCKVETTSGTVVEGAMVGLDLTTGILTLRLQEGAPAVKVAFGNFRRLTLTTPLKAADDTFESFEPIPAAAQEREYRLEWAYATHAPTAGRSAAYVEKAEGLFLFTPAGDERSVLRVFVPRAAYMTCTFGQSAEEVAMPSAYEVTADQVRAWTFLGWRSLLDADKYLRRSSPWEAHNRLHDARQHIWALWATARRTAYPQHGLSQVLDQDPPTLPQGIEATVCGLDLEDLRATVLATAAVLHDVSTAAAQRCAATLPTELAAYIRPILSAG